MDRLPTEIWESIFQHACTDGGPTGRSLSLVSKRARDLSSPSKYYTLVLHARQDGFASFLRFLNSGMYSIERQPVHHLLFSVARGYCHDSNTIDNAIHILSLLSPGLHSLTLIQLSTIVFQLLSSIQDNMVFPHLTHLTIIANNPDDLYRICSLQDRRHDGPVAFPRVHTAKLHFGGAMFKELFHALVSSAPSLQVLRIAQPKIIRTSDLLIALRLFYGIGEQRRKHDAEPAHRVVVEVETIRELGVGGLSWLHERTALEQIAARDERLRIKPQSPSRSAEALVRQWLDGEPC